MKYYFQMVLDFPKDFYRKCKRGIQRAYRGWADEDCWSLDLYFSKVIQGSINHLKNNRNGYPSDITSERWTEILTQIEWTFSIVQKIIQSERIIVQEIHEWKDSVYEDFIKKYGTDISPLTYEETLKYEHGWILIKKYFMHLWD